MRVHSTSDRLLSSLILRAGFYGESQELYNQIYPRKLTNYIMIICSVYIRKKKLCDNSYTKNYFYRQYLNIFRLKKLLYNDNKLFYIENHS